MYVHDQITYSSFGHKKFADNKDEGCDNACTDINEGITEAREDLNPLAKT